MYILLGERQDWAIRQAKSSNRWTSPERPQNDWVPHLSLWQEFFHPILPFETQYVESNYSIKVQIFCKGNLIFEKKSTIKYRHSSIYTVNVGNTEIKNHVNRGYLSSNTNGEENCGNQNCWDQGMPVISNKLGGQLLSFSVHKAKVFQQETFFIIIFTYQRQ